MLKRKFKTVFNLLYNKPIGKIYMLHRVCAFEDGRLSLNENMKVSSEFLERFIIENLGKYEFLSLDKVANVITKTYKCTKPFIAFTLDDGYIDNYQYAFPIFQKYNIPFAIYVTTGLVDRLSWLWWYQLEDVVMQNNSVELSNNTHFSCGTILEKESAFLQIRKIILELPTADFNNQVQKLLSNYTLNFGKYSKELIMSWDQIIEMSISPICTIAAHTVSHRRLSELSEAELIKEVTDCKRIIENRIKREVNHFSYPFGTSFEVNNLVVDAVKQSGYKTATFADGGVIRKLDKDLYQLKRIMLCEV